MKPTQGLLWIWLCRPSPECSKPLPQRLTATCPPLYLMPWGCPYCSPLLILNKVDGPFSRNEIHPDALIVCQGSQGTLICQWPGLLNQLYEWSIYRLWDFAPGYRVPSHCQIQFNIETMLNSSWFSTMFGPHPHNRSWTRWTCDAFHRHGVHSHF